MKKANFQTDFLFPDSDFIVGVGSVFNLAGNYYEFAVSKSEKEADCKALRSDWGMIGQDIKKVMNDEKIDELVESDTQPCEI